MTPAARRIGELLSRERRPAGYTVGELAALAFVERREIRQRADGEHFGAPRRTVALIRLCRASYGTLEHAEALALSIHRQRVSSRGDG